MGEPIFDADGNPIGELIGGVLSAGMSGLEAGLFGIFATVFIGALALAMGIVVGSPIAAFYYGFRPGNQTPMVVRVVLWIYLGAYLTFAWYVIPQFLF